MKVSNNVIAVWIMRVYNINITFSNTTKLLPPWLGCRKRGRARQTSPAIRMPLFFVPINDTTTQIRKPFFRYGSEFSTCIYTTKVENIDVELQKDTNKQ